MSAQRAISEGDPAQDRGIPGDESVRVGIRAVGSGAIRMQHGGAILEEIMVLRKNHFRALPLLSLLRRALSGLQKRLTIRFALPLLLLTMWGHNPTLYAQGTATLNGTVYDPSGAVIPNATVQIKNEASGVTRNTVSNHDGYFTVTAIPPGSYTATVSATGFKTWQEPGVVFTEGEVRTLPNLKLNMGSSADEVVVSGEAASTIPVDTGALGTTLNNYMVSDISIVGRNAGELIKFMPGMGMNGGLVNSASFNDQTVGTNTGPAGNYSPNGGQPSGSLGYYLDGVNIEDNSHNPQLINVNQDK